MADEQYTHQEYPKFRHHPSKESVQVKDPDDERKKAPDKDGWVDLKREADEKAEAAKAAAEAKKP